MSSLLVMEHHAGSNVVAAITVRKNKEDVSHGLAVFG
jgi:hypothetical protein